MRPFPGALAARKVATSTTNPGGASKGELVNENLAQNPTSEEVGPTGKILKHEIEPPVGITSGS
jgi:hypothetical protein